MVRGFVGVLAIAAGVTFGAAAPSAWHEIADRPLTFLSFFGLTVVLQLLAVSIRDRGAVSVAGIGFLTTGFTLGVGAAMATALAAAVAHAAHRRPPVHRAIFNAASFSLSAAAATALYVLVENPDTTMPQKLAAAFASGVVFWALNVGLLTTAMALSEGRRPVTLWRERLGWLTPYYFAFGLLALGSSLLYEDLGAFGLAAFAAPAALLVVRAALPRRVRAAA